MRYLPHTPDDIDAMLRTIGAASIDALFQSIPDALRLKGPLALPPACSEPELWRALQGLAEQNATPQRWASFLGGGSYRHFIPAVVWQLVSRGEFLTPYTPYQPELSQGTLQAIFEYQSMMCELFGLDIANASTYDLSTGIVEAVFMAQRITRRSEYCVMQNVHPEIRAVTRTIVGLNPAAQATLVPYTRAGTVDLAALQCVLRPTCSACVVQYPSFFGTIEDLRPIADAVHAAGALLIVAVPDPIAMGLIEAPGTMGADIVVAEGQALGNPTSYGGPYVGIFATRTAYVRQMPGRLTGVTSDVLGRRSFVLTLTTREQHIRRERATSNLCTNQQLCALATTIYTAWLGKEGFRRLARINWEKAEYAREELTRLAGVRATFSAPTFHECVITLPCPAASLLAALQEDRIFGGIALSRWYDDLPNALLVCVTEENTREEIDRFVAAVERHIRG
ncbi:MAG: aminomethyl-transferring glycine dehydrogenase subunit GcvPA [Deltaproteobacteria bacterium]|nr:aminomethyl-transferring glycine dehydrogenase subunit GcvPA [Deltaproteobacteria bacterium]